MKEDGRFNAVCVEVKSGNEGDLELSRMVAMTHLNVETKNKEREEPRQTIVKIFSILNLKLEPILNNKS
jgi:hypothetical protein